MVENTHGTNHNEEEKIEDTNENRNHSFEHYLKMVESFNDLRSKKFLEIYETSNSKTKFENYKSELEKRLNISNSKVELLQLEIQDNELTVKELDLRNVESPYQATSPEVIGYRLGLDCRNPELYRLEFFLEDYPLKRYFPLKAKKKNEFDTYDIVQIDSAFSSLRRIFKGYVSCKTVEHLRGLFQKIVEPEIKPTEPTNTKDKLTTKQQILLLHKLGVFDLPKMKNLPLQKLGILFSNILNRHEKNTEDTIRDRFDDNHFSSKDKDKIAEILTRLGLDKIEKM